MSLRGGAESPGKSYQRDGMAVKVTDWFLPQRQFCFGSRTDEKPVFGSCRDRDDLTLS